MLLANHDGLLALVLDNSRVVTRSRSLRWRAGVKTHEHREEAIDQTILGGAPFALLAD